MAAVFASIEVGWWAWLFLDGDSGGWGAHSRDEWGEFGGDSFS